MDKPKITFMPAGAVIQQVLSGKPFTLVYTVKNLHFSYKTSMTKGHPPSTLVKVQTKGGKFKPIGLLFLHSYQLGALGSAGITGPKEDLAAFSLFHTYWNLLKRNTPSMEIVYWPPTRCAKCKRLLTDPSSIMDGAGPVCKTHIA